MYNPPNESSTNKGIGTLTALGSASQRLPVARRIDPAQAVEGRRARRHPQVRLRRGLRGVKPAVKNHRSTIGKP